MRIETKKQWYELVSFKILVNLVIKMDYLYLNFVFLNLPGCLNLPGVKRKNLMAKKWASAIRMRIASAWSTKMFQKVQLILKLKQNPF